MYIKQDFLQSFLDVSKIEHSSRTFIEFFIGLGLFKNK